MCVNWISKQHEINTNKLCVCKISTFTFFCYLMFYLKNNKKKILLIKKIKIKIRKNRTQPKIRQLVQNWYTVTSSATRL